MTKVRWLFLHVNQLAGELPRSLVASSALGNLRFDYNAGLCAPDNYVFREWLDGIGYRLGPICQTTHADDRAALIALYEATKGSNRWNDANWLSDKPVYAWYGVTTDDGGRVSGLRLQHNQLSGQIPLELGSLTNLEDLSLFDNQLSGQIPLELGSLTSLEDLSLFDNQLSGQIPVELGSLTSLEDLSLSNNQLSGQIPVELGSLTSLEDLSLSNNQLSGQIPLELGSLTNLKSLSLYWNELSGQISPRTRQPDQPGRPVSIQQPTERADSR